MAKQDFEQFKQEIKNWLDSTDILFGNAISTQAYEKGKK